MQKQRSANRESLQSNRRYRIAEFNRPFSDLALRLRSLGLTRGTILEITGKAPFGDPIVIRSRGYNLSLRRAELAELRLETIESEL